MLRQRPGRLPHRADRPQRPLSSTGRRIVLLRAINLGSSRRVSMPELRALLEDAGYDDVRTHLQSGNVVLTSGASPKRLRADLERLLAGNLGAGIDVIVRTRDQLADIVKLDPLGKVATNPSRYLVTFLAEKPAAKVVRGLEGVDVEPERFVIRGSEVYAWHPNGVQRSKVNRLIQDRLGVGTARNWNTVTKLLSLADG